MEQEERRVWVRYPAQIDAQFKPTGAAADMFITGKVLDVSLGGIRLLVDRCLEAGALISLDLPGGVEASHVSVLACVVHSQPQPKGGWLLGCSFSQELSLEDLARFGVGEVKHNKADQRSWLRFNCNVKAFYEETTADPVIRREAEVANLSAAGIALVVQDDVANGAMLSVELQKSSGERVTTILACVVHVVDLADGKRVLGCNFIRALADQHLNALLFETVRT